jgi:glucosyl-3-phosphoglycerate phosphatase
MAGTDEILLARHGETDDNAVGRFQGHRNPPLNERGRAQARALADAVAGEGIVALYASPLRRARETAEIVGAGLGLEPVLDERLMEIDVGEWAGLLHHEIPDGDLERWRAAEPSFRFPGGESVAEQVQRVDAAIGDVRAAGRLPALVVCHGGTIRAALRRRMPGDAVANGSVHRV